MRNNLGNLAQFPLNKGAIYKDKSSARINKDKSNPYDCTLINVAVPATAKRNPQHSPKVKPKGQALNGFRVEHGMTRPSPQAARLNETRRAKRLKKYFALLPVNP